MHLVHTQVEGARRVVPRDVVVVGAGAAGLACAAELQRTGHAVTVLERAARVGESWRGRYDRLRLNTSRPFSKLLGMPYPAGTPMFPSRDQVVEYLERFALEAQLDIHFGVAVRRIDRDCGDWRVGTDGAT
jgi:cation diffusion facilitator CzcD-associated flavoprotein CzcO